ncbi:FecR family protein, partial [Luteimonas sp. SDU101]|uniref:FecR family protein n=1 Tax=Luteimonas sp. SDU101 TaxID=3422593 RepID=UPI003EC0B23D
AQLLDHDFASRPPRPRGRIRLALAAALAACALALGWGWRAYAPAAAEQHATALGDVRQLDLADGSQATLASDSAIAVRLSRRARHIALGRGEAYFEAAKDPSRPFVVEAGMHRVVAVGTRFAVRREDAGLRVVVTEGLVRLEDGEDGGTPDTLLPAGSVALVRRDQVLVRSLPLDEAARLVDWRSGLLVFRDTSLADAASEFNRYNARKILIADARVGDLRIGGSFRWANAEGFVRLLEQGFPVRAEYRDDRIVLHAP